jgi:enterochelin esterase family protein
MGGGHTTSATILYPGVFGYICPLSCGIRDSDHLDADLQGIKKAGYKLYWIGVGKEDTGAYNGSLILDEALTRNGMPHTLYVSDDAHVWKNWRLYLNTFARLLFK